MPSYWTSHPEFGVWCPECGAPPLCGCFQSSRSCHAQRALFYKDLTTGIWAADIAEVLATELEPWDYDEYDTVSDPAPSAAPDPEIQAGFKERCTQGILMDRALTLHALGLVDFIAVARHARCSPLEAWRGDGTVRKRTLDLQRRLDHAP